MAEGAEEVLSTSPGRFEFLDLRWLQPAGSPSSRCATLAFRSLQAAVFAVSTVLLATEQESLDSETKRYEFIHKKKAVTDKDKKSLIL